MPFKDSENQKRYQAEHYQANKESYRKATREYRQRLAALIAEAKDVPCTDCGIKYPYYVMDFDHRDPSTKLMDISRAAKTKSKQKLLDEMEKCDVVCANCHRIRTFQRRSQEDMAFLNEQPK